MSIVNAALLFESPFDAPIAGKDQVECPADLWLGHRKLNERGIQPPRSGCCHPNSVRRVLQLPNTDARVSQNDCPKLLDECPAGSSKEASFGHQHKRTNKHTFSPGALLIMTFETVDLSWLIGTSPQNFRDQSG
jgi:hypothetical protein